MAEALHELVELRRLPLQPVAEHLIEVPEHLLDLAQMLGLELLHGTRHVLEVRLRDLLLELLHELLEGLRRPLIHELVVVELPNGAPHVVR